MTNTQFGQGGMLQPRAKLEFVRRYCPPEEGWTVFVDIDASEEGRTGGKRKRAEAAARQVLMQNDAAIVRDEFRRLGVTVGGRRDSWAKDNGLPLIKGDRDIVAYHKKKKLLVIAEVEGESSRQPEQKLYQAIGQIVTAVDTKPPIGWKRRLVLVVCGQRITEHLKNASALERLGVSAVAVSKRRDRDFWVFGAPVDLST